VIVEVGSALGICGIAFASNSYSHQDWQTAPVSAIISVGGVILDALATSLPSTLQNLDRFGRIVDVEVAAGSGAELVGYWP
jgi:hypothetical protein